MKLKSYHRTLAVALFATVFFIAYSPVTLLAQIGGTASPSIDEPAAIQEDPEEPVAIEEPVEEPVVIEETVEEPVEEPVIKDPDAEKTPEGALIRSLALPGWGQFYNDESTKGYIFAGAAGALTVTSILLYLDAESTYDDYEDGKASYSDYTKKIDTTNIFVGITAAVWIYNAVDAYMGGVRQRDALADSSNIKLAADMDSAYIVFSRNF